MTPKPPEPPKPNKQRFFIGLLLAIVLVGGIASFMMNGGKTKKPAAKKSEIISITLPPPPPPPPPPPKIEPPKQEPPPDEKQEEIVEAEPEPNEPPPEAPDEPPSEVLGTNIKGDGPGLAGLGSSGDGGGNRNSIGGGGSKQARIDWYARRILVTTIKQALQTNPSTKSAIMDDGIRVWIDAEGRVTRIKPLGSTSNLAALEQVLIGLQTSQAPPAGMPPYIDFKINARKAAL
jgi:protein TonB